MRIRQFIPLITLALAPAACRAAFDYPEAKDESGPGLCANGEDDDFDGVIDCDDPSCDGVCEERDAVRCADGRDNDGDGLTDGLDARCWHLASPTATRCASLEAVDFEERFDALLSDARWMPFGKDPVTGAIAVQVVAPTNRTGRPDSVLGFSGLTDETIATGLSSKALFDGDWTSFELAFRGLVDGGGGMRVALVPSNRALAGRPPLEGALLASLAIDVQPSGRVALIVDGTPRDAGAIAPGVWHDYRLFSRKGESVALKVDGSVVLEAQSQALSAARLVVWGDAAGVAQLDDLHVWIAGSHPGGVTTPQIPLCKGCLKDSSLFPSDTGWTVSVARDETGTYCALTTDGEPGQSTARGGSSWLSNTGEVWRPGGDLSAGLDGDLWIGASVTRDAGALQWRALIVTEGVDGTSLHRLSSADCVVWTFDGILPLPAGAHSPSYLLPGVVSLHEVYFVLPFTPGEGPALWRYRSDDGEVFVDDGIPVTTFPIDAGMDAPISVTRAGKRDVILTHRIPVKTGTLGLGLWVADDDALSSWRRASNHPLLQTNGLRGGFDSKAIASGTVFWDGEAGFLLYGARGQPVWDPFGEDSRSPLSVATASLTFAGEPSPASPFSDRPVPAVHPGSCGDGTCEGDETCSSCASDCGVCDGELRFADAFDDAASWTSADDDHASVYISSLAERLVLAPGDARWMVRTLSHEIVGDFELSFDARWIDPEGATEDERCPALIGLAKGSDEEEVAEGVFAQLDQQLPGDPGLPAFSAYVRVGPSRYPSLEVNKKTRFSRGKVTGYREAWHHVVLRRGGGEVTIAISAGPSCEGEAEREVFTRYAGPIDAFDRLAVGWGRAGWTEQCGTKAAGLSIDNLVVRSLPCLERQSCVEAQTQQTVCVDLTSSPEHCGGCNAAVEPGERCEGGEATCAGELCPVGDTGLVVCTDIRTSPKHCGGCGQEVGTLEVCREGIPVAAMVELPEGYAIDATEVTAKQYQAWLATDPLISNQHESCTWNSSFEEKCIGPTEQPALPVTCVNWCDAYAYCAAVGKRLCTTLEWRGACAGGGAGNDYPYGSEYEPLACNGADTMHEGYSLDCAPMSDAGALTSCQSSVPGYEGVYDLSGNVGEWTEECLGDKGKSDNCQLVGGSNCALQADLRCVTSLEMPRSGARANAGVRCCS